MTRPASPREVLYALGERERAYCERLTGLPFEHFARAYLRSAGERIQLDDLEPARARRVLSLAAETLRKGFDPSIDADDLSHPVFVAEAAKTVCSEECEPANWPADVLHHTIMRELRALRAAVRRDQRARKRAREQGAA